MIRCLPALFGLLQLPSPAGAGQVPLAPGSQDPPVTAAAFRDCFIASQDKVGRPWAFVPDEAGGGVFSTVPAADGVSPYYLSVREQDGARRITLSGEATPGSGPAIGTAIGACLG